MSTQLDDIDYHRFSFWCGVSQRFYRNKRVDDKYLLGVVIAETNRRTVDAASGDSTRRAVVGEFKFIVPTGEVMRISTYKSSKQQVK